MIQWRLSDRISIYFSMRNDLLLDGAVSGEAADQCPCRAEKFISRSYKCPCCRRLFRENPKVLFSAPTRWLDIAFRPTVLYIGHACFEGVRQSGTSK